MPVDEGGADASVVLLVGAVVHSARLSDGLMACADWPPGLRLVNVAEQAAASSCGEAQCLAAWRAGVQTDASPLCTLLVTSPQEGDAESAAGTQVWRQALSEANWPHAVLHGDESAQQAAALAVVLHAWARRQRGPERGPMRKWRWICEDCDDGDCEQHWLPGAGKPAP